MNFTPFCILSGQAQGADQAAQQQQQDQNALANMAMAVSVPQIFGDERDAIIARWNQVQACWGNGKGYFSQNGAVDFKPNNPFCRFKVSIDYQSIFLLLIKPTFLYQ